MTNGVVDLQRMARRRLEKFHAQCRESAKSRKNFEKNFMVDSRHIGKRAGDQNSSIRNSIRDEHIAAVILGGQLAYGDCKDSHPIVIAIDGIFRDFRYIEMLDTQGMRETVLERVRVRVVLRDGRVRITVVTVYSMQDRLDENVPEVEYEIW